VSSLARKIEKGRFAPGWKRRKAAERQTRDLDDGGYAVLHPTKGWRAFSQRRVSAFALTSLKRQGNAPWWLGIAAFEAGAAA